LGSVRIQKTDIIAGLPASVARDAVRIFAGSATPARSVALVLAKLGREDIDAVVTELNREGFVEPSAGRTDDDPWWVTTIKGNALAMASFGRPISRRTADRLLLELLDRVHSLNADQHQLFSADRVRIFGSYLDKSVDPLGDLDVEVTLARRVSVQELSDYGRASGKRFGTHLSQLTWAEREFVQKLRASTAAINITREDVSAFTDRTQTVYERSQDPDAVAFVTPVG
jgi:predicted nucleotidyltransferase